MSTVCTERLRVVLCDGASEDRVTFGQLGVLDVLDTQQTSIDALANHCKVMSELCSFQNQVRKLVQRGTSLLIAHHICNTLCQEKQKLILEYNTDSHLY